MSERGRRSPCVLGPEEYLPSRQKDECFPERRDTRPGESVMRRATHTVVCVHLYTRREKRIGMVAGTKPKKAARAGVQGAGQGPAGPQGLHIAARDGCTSIAATRTRRVGGVGTLGASCQLCGSRFLRS